LDREEREMSEKRATAGVDLHHAIPRLAVDIAAGRAIGFIFISIRYLVCVLFVWSFDTFIRG
jgi:hypothetical protein